MFLEVLLAAGILAACIGILTVQSDAWQAQRYKLQVRIAAQSLAADIRHLQQQALFDSDGTQVFLTVSSSEKKAYSFKRNLSIVSSVKFSKLNCEGVYFSTSIARLGFSKAGAPTASGSYILQHEALPSYRCVLSLQPVTGRVSVYERE